MSYSLLAMVLLSALNSSFLEAKATTVTTYVTTVQEERESTRWTLTKWLEIKERMKLMDVWLAMFSDPQKDRFAPELMLSFGRMRGDFSYLADSNSEKLTKTDSQAGQAQLWLTNIVSSTIGIRSLNIDFGGEGFAKETNTALSSDVELNEKTSNLQHYTGNLRIFGKHVQDSSLVLKYGGYKFKSPVLNIEQKGEAVGAELQLYLIKWLGAEGHFMQYGKKSGTYYDYQAYIEISILRFSVGPYSEDWTTTRDNIDLKTTERGLMGSLKVSL